MSPAAASGGSRWTRNPRVLWRYTGHGVLVLPLSPGGQRTEPVSLDPAATLVWEVLSRPGTVDEISEEVARRAGTTHGTVASGVAHTLAELDRQGAVRRDDG